MAFQRLNILLLNSLYPPFVVGGAELVTEMLALGLVEDGHRVTVVTSCSKETGQVLSRENGIDIYRLFPKNLWWLYDRFGPGDTRSPLAKLRWRLRDAWNDDAAAQFRTILESVEPSIVHTHNVKGLSPAVWYEARRFGAPIVHTSHSYELICVDGSLLDSRQRTCRASHRCVPCKVQGSWYLRQARHIDIFCSPSQYLLRAHQEAGLTARRLAHVPNGVSNRAGSRPPKMRDPGQPLRFLYLGQLTSHKGVGVLIEAAKLLAPALPVVIDVAGKGIDEAKIVAQAETDARVQFHGFVSGPRKEELLAAADVLIFPSIWVENAPMTICEALVRSLPVIASDLGAMPEFVDHDRNGLLFRPGSPVALAECISALANDEALLARLTRGAAASGRDLPSSKDMTLAYVDLYRSLLPSRERSEVPAGSAATMSLNEAQL